MSKYLFFDNDSKIIEYQNLKTWDIIDKKIISSYLLWQKSLEKDNILDFIKNINNPINKEDCKKLKKIIKKNSDYHKKLWDSLPPNIIRIYNLFLFSPFIFWGVLVTYFTWKNMLVIILFEVWKSIMSLWT